MRYNSIIWLMILLLVATMPFAYRRSQRDNVPVIFPITLLVTTEVKCYRMELEEYLVGVVAAEMPARFSIEALKAQAVAARTLTVKRLKRFGGEGCRHASGVDLCDSPDESQAWLSKANLQAKWGKNKFPEYYQRISRAVRETNGIIMLYRGKPIDAVFHSTCGVGTASAVEVWQSEVPYLQSVSCGFDRHSPRYQNQVWFSYRDLARRLRIPEQALHSLKARRRSPRGRILELNALQYRISGRELRQALDLTSTSFRWEQVGNGLRFNTIGYGHGVGLCQFGADGMAKQGYKYQAILRHYYRGVKFSKIKY